MRPVRVVDSYPSPEWIELSTLHLSLLVAASGRFGRCVGCVFTSDPVPVIDPARSRSLVRKRYLPRCELAIVENPH